MICIEIQSARAQSAENAKATQIFSVGLTVGYTEYGVNKKCTRHSDPDVGFLLNKAKPEGQGNDSFTIDLKDILKHETVILNQALIYFDANVPIITNTYQMTLDLMAPESKDNPLQTSSDSFTFNTS